MFFSKKKKEDLETLRDIADDVEESDFVPYSCHFNPHTIITKNGELLQTICISGLESSELESDVRDSLRKAIRNHVISDSYAIWFHTIRRKKDFSLSCNVDNDFVSKVDSAWEDKNKFSNQFYNEVYVTIVRDGQDASLLSSEVLLRGVRKKTDIAWRNEYLDNIYSELDAVVSGVLSELDVMGARKLGVEKRGDIYYSELIEFLEKLINLDDRPMFLPMEDLSKYLTSGEITFGFNAMEVRSESGKRRFASIITVKEYKESSLPAIDIFLRVPIEFIATQCIDFINAKDALNRYNQQKHFTILSEDDHLAKINELDYILESNKNNPVDFGEQQLSVFIQADSIKQLESYVRKAIDNLGEYGIVAIREDIYFEECYWSQLPGNFEFIRRLMPTNTAHVGGFANLNNQSVGRAKGNYWGDAVSVFHTASGSPYYFNFHDGNCGHTSIVGRHGTGKTILSNFLLAQAMKFKPRVFYFDFNSILEGFIVELGGEYHSVDNIGKMGNGLNPFSLSDSIENKQFIIQWLGVLVRMGGIEVNDSIKHAIQSSVIYIYSQPENVRDFSLFISYIKSSFPDASNIFSKWESDGEYGYVLNGTAQSHFFANDKMVYGFGLRTAFNTPNLFIPLVSFMLQYIASLQDKVSTIIVLDEAWSWVKNTHIAIDIVAWLEKLKHNNMIAIFLTEDIESAGAEPLIKQVSEQCVTQIYLPDDEDTDIYASYFNMSELEITYLNVIDSEQRHFLIKQYGKIVVGMLNLNGLPEIIDVLGGKLEGDNNLELNNNKIVMDSIKSSVA